MATKVSLDAYVLPDGHKIFKFFPGKAYKFYDAVVQSSVVFLDLRSLETLDKDPHKWTDDALVTAIATDRVDRLASSGAARPKRLVRSVGDKANRTFAKSLLLEARKGDFVIMPPKEYTDDVMVGELLDEPGVLTTVRTSDGGHVGNYLGRRVKWLNPIPKRLLDDEIVALLHTPTTFFSMKDKYHNSIYRLALDNYVLESQFVATFRTSKNIFTSKDNLLTSLWFELMEVVEEAHESGEPLKLASIYELAVHSEIDEDERSDLSIFVQSPGWFKLRSFTSSPMVAMALFVMAVSALPYEQALLAQVSAHVVQNADNSCLGVVDESVRKYLEILGKDRWEESCKLAVQASAVATLKTKADLKPLGRRVRNRK